MMTINASLYNDQHDDIDDNNDDNYNDNDAVVYYDNNDGRD